MLLTNGVLQGLTRLRKKLENLAITIKIRNINDVRKYAKNTILILAEVRKLDIKYLPELMEEYYRPEFAKESLGNIQISINNAKGVIEKWS